MAKAGEYSTALTAERLRELLDYDSATGEFRWKIRRAGTAKIGAVAGHAGRRDYRAIKVDGRFYKAHRLAWLHVYGEWPPSGLDHKNGRHGDNSINNLRLATVSQNQGNSRRRSDNMSGFKGASYKKTNKKWQAQIAGRYLGLFATAEEAHAAYVAAAADVFGEFANAGSLPKRR